MYILGANLMLMFAVELALVAAFYPVNIITNK